MAGDFSIKPYLQAESGVYGGVYIADGGAETGITSGAQANYKNCFMQCQATIGNTFKADAKTGYKINLCDDMDINLNVYARGQYRKSLSKQSFKSNYTAVLGAETNFIFGKNGYMATGAEVGYQKNTLTEPVARTNSGLYMSPTLKGGYNISKNISLEGQLDLTQANLGIRYTF